MGLVEMTLYAIGCMPLLPCRHCVKPANNVTGGKASLCDWLPQKHIETRKKCIALLQGELKSPAECATQSTTHVFNVLYPHHHFCLPSMFKVFLRK